MTPEVTILMPAYNAGKYIWDAIDSVLNQTFTNFQLLIINDGSTDQTISVIEQFDDHRLSVIHQTNKGIAAALNNGLREAKGRFIARFDADDICLPQRLEKQVSFLKNNTDYVITGCDAEYISESGEHLFNFKCSAHSHESIIDRLYFYCPFIHSGVMYRKQAVLDCGGYCEDAHTFEDYLLWVQLATKGKYYNIPEQLIKVRFNPNSITIDEKWRSKRFREIKRDAISKGAISKNEGDELLELIREQDTEKVKVGSYYALCGKKFLVDNHHPIKARDHLSKAIRTYPLRWDNYALYFLSFFPRQFINWLHQKNANRI